MKSFTYTVTDPVGLHARPAASLSRRASSLASDIQVEANGKSVNAKSMISVMTLGVRQGDEVTFTVSGETEGVDCKTLQEFCAAEI